MIEQKPTKEQLIRWYYDEKLNTNMIAEKIGVTSTTIKKWMHKYGLKLRSKKEMCKFRRKKKVWLKNGRVNHVSGYVRLWNPILKKYEWEHRVAWEKNYGEIPNEYCIHHINGKKDDNRIENLMVLPSSIHNSIETLKGWQNGFYDNQKGKNYDERFGIEKSILIRKKIGEASKRIRKEKFWSSKKKK